MNNKQQILVKEFDHGVTEGTEGDERRDQV